MPFAVRALAFCLLALPVAGCGGSNNKNKIEGRWKFVPGDSPDESKLRDAELWFGDLGDVTLKRPGAKPVTWRYKLLAGDAADFYDLAPDATNRCGLFSDARGSIRLTMRIEVTSGEKYERHTMTLTDPSGRKLTLRRVRTVDGEPELPEVPG